jgi:uracil-DNA glycosylase family 4
MEGRTRVLGPANGNLHARVLFVAEAPGRLGGDRTGVPLSGDQTGRNFDLLLRASGLSRSDIFITNAALCNPRDEHGLNSTPTARELRNCSNYLRHTIELINPRFVVALGNIALRALSYITPHNATLTANVAQALPWNGRYLVLLYHPGPRALIRRPLALQLEDYARLRNLIGSE